MFLNVSGNIPGKFPRLKIPKNFATLIRIHAKVDVDIFNMLTFIVVDVNTLLLYTFT